MKTCKITIHDNIKCTVSGIPEAHHNIFTKSISAFANNYQFNPKYKLGVWDGKIRYYWRDGTTYLNLLEDVIPKLIALEYEIDIEDNRPPTRTIPANFELDEHIFSEYTWDNGKPITLWDHQLRVVRALLKSDTGVADAVTGAGKSIICAAIAHIMKQHGLRTIVIVPSMDLVTQTKATFNRVGLDCGEYSGQEKSYDNDVVMSTWQALQNNPTILQNFNCVIVDETHGIKDFNVIFKLLLEYGNHMRYRYGVTGTIPKADIDRLTLRSMIGNVLVKVPAKELIEKGILAKPTIKMVTLEEDFTDKYKEYEDQRTNIATAMSTPKLTYRSFKKQYFPDFTSEKSYLQKRLARLETISMILTAISENGNTLILTDGINFGKKISSMIPDSVYLSGKDKSNDRMEIYRLFANNDNMKVVANIPIASTGLDIPRIFNLAYVDIGKSFTRVMQSIGRGLRTADDKKTINIYDIHSDLKASTKHKNERAAFYREAEHDHRLIKIDYDNLTEEAIIDAIFR